MGKEAEEEKIKKVAKLRTRLQKRIADLEAEQEELRFLLTLMDEKLLEKGFKRAKLEEPVLTPAETPEAAPTPSEPAPSATPEYERSIPIKTVTGNLLATIHASEDSMQIVPAEDKTFNVKTPPFRSFLVERVLTKMQETDREAARKGELTPEKMLSFNIARDGDQIRELTIRNIRSGRVRELKSAIRWTLEKMYEKTQQEG
jgi:hypothetical protein